MREISVFLSSPTDVEHERLRAERVVERLNGQYAAVVRLTAIRWEQKFYEARTGFQEQIPEASKCDLVIGILWSRLGSELPSDMPPMPSGEPYPSGTAYEVLTAIEQSKASGRPSVYLFRKTAPTVLPVEDDAKRALVIEQLDRLKAFWERWIKAPQGAFKAGYQEFSGPDEFESQLEALLHAWLDERVLKGRAVVWPLEKGSPFRGLAAFGAKHAPVFFGRGNDITRGVDALKDAAEHGHPFLLLIGPSGAGKSSLARAGLSPRLTTPGVVPVVDQWRVALMRPGERKGEPVLGLALHLFDGPKDIPAEEEGRPPALPELGKSSHKTPQILAQALGAGDAASVLWALDSIAAATRESEGYDRPVRADLLLIVDQLDELFAADVEEEEREAFAKALAALVATGRVWVIATLRTDLYERLQQDPVLLALKQSGSAYDLAPPGAAELAEIVRKPAEAAGLTYERDAKTGKSLDEQLLEDAGRPDMLPLVQFALQELFDRREVKGEDTLLTFAAYTELGGLDGAIDKRAEAAIASLGEAEKAVLPRLLRQLAVPARDKGGEATLTIRSVPLSEAAPDEPTKRLAQALVDARILLSSGETGTPSIRLAHERVLKSWKRARDIVRANEDFYRIRANVEEQLARWKSAAQSPDLLIPPGLPLEESRKLITGYGAELEPGMRSYIDASLVEDDKRVRGRRLRYRLAAAAAVIFACVAVFAGWQWQVADRQQRIATMEKAEKEAKLREAQINESKYLSASARDALANSNVDLAKSLLSLAMPTSFTNPERPLVPSGTNLIPDIIGQDPLEAILVGHTDALRQASFSPDGNEVLTAAADGTARIWDAATGATRQIFRDQGSPVTSASYSPDGKKVVVGSEDGIGRVWDVASGASPTLLKGHEQEIESAVFSPDGTWILTASYDGTARIWDAATGATLQVLAQSEPEPLAIAVFSPDARYVVTGTKTGSVSQAGGAIIWDAASGAKLHDLGSHEKPVRIVSFSPDGSQVLTGSYDDRAEYDANGKRLLLGSDEGTVRIWSVDDGVLLQTLKGPGIPVYAAVFSPDGSRVVTGAYDGIVRIFDAGGGTLLQELNGHEGPVYGVAFSPDGTRLATASEDKTVRIYDASTGKLIETLKGHSGPLYEVQFSPDGVRLLTASYDNSLKFAEYSDGKVWPAPQDYTARIWSVGSNGTALSRCPPLELRNGEASEVRTATFSPDGDRVLTASYDETGKDPTARLFDATTGKLLLEFKGHEGPLYGARFSPDGKKVLTASGDKTARIWDASTGASLHVLNHRDQVWSAVFSPDGSTVLTASQDGTAALWDVSSGNLLEKFENYGAPVIKAAFDSSGRRIVVIPYNLPVDIRDAKTGRSLQTLKGHTGPVYDAAFSPDGTRVVTASRDKTAMIWDVATGALIQTLKGHEENVRIAVFSPDGTRVLTGSDDKTARVWDAVTGAPLLILKGHTDLVTSAAYGDVGRSVLTSSKDGSARIWDATSGEPLEVLKDHKAAVNEASISGDGERVVTASSDGTARVWKFSPELPALISYFRASISQPVTAQERSSIGLPDNALVAPPPTNSVSRRCTALTAQPFDPNVVGVGVPWDRLDAQSAIAACEQALLELPNDAHLQYQLGRAQARAREEASDENSRTELGAAVEANYRAAAAQGYPMALFALADFEETPPEEAVKLYKRAYEGGIGLAARGLSRHFASGKGVSKDMREARRWLELGADQGDPDAASELGRMYWNGNSDFNISQDWEQALFYFTVSVKRYLEKGYGDSEAIKLPMLFRANISRHLEMDKVAAIWDRVQTWEPPSRPANEASQ